MGDFLKKGWHPQGKEGGKESWRGDFKGVNQVAGWMGKSKKPGDGAEENTHISRPLATLKDPALFGPPPRNVNYHGGAALPHETTPHTSGLGAPLSQDEIQSARQLRTPVLEEEVESQRAPPPPPLPFRSDRTGLTTTNLPTPPVRRNLAGGADEKQTPTSARPSPGPPPRLPSRRSAVSSPITVGAAPPAYESVSHTNTPTLSMNQTAMSSLGNAGVSVPAFGIGKNSTSNAERNPWLDEKSPNTSTSVSELGSRFKRMTSSEDTSTKNTASVSPSPQTQRQPPSWQQTQTSLRTAQNFHQNPSSVTLADAQQAANTAQSAHASAVDYRAKHADKFDAAERKAHTFNKKYNVTGRLNKFLEDANEDDQKSQTQQQQGQLQPQPHAPTNGQNPQQLPPATQQNGYTVQRPQRYQRQSPPPPQPVTSPQPQTTTTTTSSIAGRKPPPPPPPKKPANMQTGNHAPPPVPLGTRPTFT